MARHVSLNTDLLRLTVKHLLKEEIMSLFMAEVSCLLLHHDGHIIKSFVTTIFFSMQGATHKVDALALLAYICNFEELQAQLQLLGGFEHQHVLAELDSILGTGPPLTEAHRANACYKRDKLVQPDARIELAIVIEARIDVLDRFSLNHDLISWKFCLLGEG